MNMTKKNNSTQEKIEKVKKIKEGFTRRMQDIKLENDIRVKEVVKNHNLKKIRTSLKGDK